MIKKLILLLLLLFVTEKVYEWYKKDLQTASAKSSDFSIKGIDISHHNESIDWDKLRENNLTFVFVKATEGGDFVDSMFESNWDNARQEGYKTGGYHYYKICTDWRLQAENIIRNIPRVANALPPVIDLEDEADCKSGDEVRFELGLLIRKLKSHYGQEPILYVNPIVPDSFYHKYLIGHFYGYVMWYRDQYKKPTKKRKWLFWQHNSKGQMRGVEGYVDKNVFNGSMEDLENLCTKSEQ